MNTYLVPTTEEYCNKYTFIEVIFAESEEEAYNKALINKGLISRKIKNYKEYPYEVFYEKLHFPERYFPISLKNDILKEIFRLKGEKYVEIKFLYDYMYFGDYNAQMQALADKALPEIWSFENKNDYGILKSYMENTFKQLQREEKVVETEEYCLFNTGLFTDNYVPIYVYGEPNKRAEAQKWYFKGFKDEYELAYMDVEVDFPERADYFEDTTLLVFNYHCKVHVNYNHILNDLNTSQRLPDSVKNSSRPLDTLKGVIDTAIQKIVANYKLAVPHYYQDRIQLLVPLYFDDTDIPDVALVLDKRKGNHYQARTCLSMEMAYMDARLIARPESNWLVPENITEDNN